MHTTKSIIFIFRLKINTTNLFGGGGRSVVCVCVCVCLEKKPVESSDKYITIKIVLVNPKFFWR